MKKQSFRYEFKGSELSYLLFKKKRCPKCGGPMEKNRCQEMTDGSVFNTNSVPLYIKGRQVKQYYYVFVCKSCGSSYTLSELSDR